MDIKEILTRLNACHGPSGDEGEVAQIIRELAAPYCQDCTSDPMGNLICHLPGPGPRVLLCAHMDSIGMIVTHIEEGGFLRFGRLGGLPLTLLHTPVRFASGLRGTIGADGTAKLRTLTLEDLFIDIGAGSKEEAEGLVSIGDTAVYDTPVRQAGDSILSPYLDNRISCAVLLSVLEQLRGVNDLYVVFSTQEELGLRGAKTAAYAVDAQYALAIDVTLSDDLPGARHQGSSVLGKGAAIKIMDHSVIAHPQVVRLLTELAQEQGIDAQKDILRSGGTDAGVIQTRRGGVYTGGVSIPCRYIHSPNELVRQSDVEACARLITAFARADLKGRCR